VFVPPIALVLASGPTLSDCRNRLAAELKACMRYSIPSEIDSTDEEAQLKWWAV
jgi:hypothetical protein